MTPLPIQATRVGTERPPRNRNAQLRDRAWVDMSWQTDDRACRGMDTERFFVGSDIQNQTATPTPEQREVIAVCRSGCPVKAECLAHALKHGEQGIWGGTTDYQRRQIRRRAKRRKIA